jgi:peptidoglycan-N-acetylglucosamine deacetylase
MRRARTIGFGVAGGLALATAAALWSAPEWLIDQLARWHPGCLYRVQTQAPLMALTIDDGPDPISTPVILDELRRQGARATFFLITERVRGQEHLVRTIITEGHELGNHFTRDRASIRLSPSAFEADLLQAHQVLAPYGALKWARPGSGWYSRAMIDIMTRHGYRCALGSVYPFDATIPSAGLATRCGGCPSRRRQPGAADGQSAERGVAGAAASRIPRSVTKSAGGWRLTSGRSRRRYRSMERRIVCGQPSRRS